MIRARGRQQVARRRRVWGWTWALAFLAGSLGASAHAAFTAHRLCPEHGEWLESAAGHAHASAPAPAAPKSSGVRALPASGAEPQSHDHCALVGATRERAALLCDGAQLALDPPAERAGGAPPPSPLPDGAPLGSPGARGPPRQA